MNPMDRSLLLALSLLTGVSQSAWSQGPTSRILILRTGKDTIAIERYTRTATKIEGELLFKLAGQRWNYSASVTADQVVTRLENQYRPATDAADQPPRQTATLEFRDDSVIVVVGSGASQVVQRLASKHGALPYINPSFALMELVAARARLIGGDSVDVPVFLVSGGQTVPVLVKRRGADSVQFDIAGSMSRVALDRDGRIRGGVIPAQNLVLEIGTPTPGLMAVVKPDYAAPAGAPYVAREVKVPSMAGHILAGTLTLPRDASESRKVAAIVTITGSGLEDRDEYISIVPGGYRPFRQVADTLGRRGIAVLRMDDRGYGASTGNGATATSADFAEDIRAGLAYLRSLPEIDENRLGLVGHSEGGLIAPMVAATDPALRGIVLLAGPAQTGRTILEYQNRYAIEHAPAYKPEKLDSLMRAARRGIDSTASVQPWIRFFLDYDPLATAKKVSVPVLILQGATDKQVTPEQAPALEAAFKAGGNRDVTMKVFPRADHLFVEDADGNPSGYAKLSTAKVRSDVLGSLADWLVAHLR